MCKKNIKYREERLGDQLFRVSDDIYRIPVPTGFAVGDVNLYFLDGPDPVLIDTGVMSDDTTKILSDSLSAINRHISDIAVILLTHTHVDHAANARQYKMMSGARVLASSRAVRRLSNIQATFQSDSTNYRDFFLRCGFSMDMVMKQQGLYAKLKKMYTSCPDVESLNDGEMLVAGGRTIHVHYRPGHSSSDVVFALQDQNILFTGDHVLPHITPNPTIEMAGPGEAHRPRALVQYQQSLLATRDMKVSLACPGHGALFYNLSRRCDQIIDMQTKRVEEIFSLILTNGLATYKELALKLFGHVHLWDIYLTISEVVGACELLEEQGRILIKKDGPVDMVSAV